MQLVFLSSPPPAPDYCEVYLNAFFPTCMDTFYEVSKVIIVAGGLLAACSVASSVQAWRRHFGAAAGFALPGIAVCVWLALSVLNSQPQLGPYPSSAPPPSLSWYVVGGYVALVGLVLLGLSFLIQLVRYRQLHRPRLT